MTIEFFNFLWIYFLNKCLFGFRLDTSRLPFSLVVRFGLFYHANFWYNNSVEFDKEYYELIRKIDLIIPWLCDIILIVKCD